MISNSNEQYNYIIDVVERINKNPPTSKKELTTANCYLYEPTTINTYPNSNVEARQIGSLLSIGLSKK